MRYEFNMLIEQDKITEVRSQDILMDVCINGDVIIILTGDDIKAEE